MSDQEALALRADILSTINNSEANAEMCVFALADAFLYYCWLNSFDPGEAIQRVIDNANKGVH